MDVTTVAVAIGLHKFLNLLILYALIPLTSHILSVLMFYLFVYINAVKVSALAELHDVSALFHIVCMRAIIEGEIPILENLLQGFGRQTTCNIGSFSRLRKR